MKWRGGDWKEVQKKCSSNVYELRESKTAGFNPLNQENWIEVNFKMAQIFSNGTGKK